MATFIIITKQTHITYIQGCLCPLLLMGIEIEANQVAIDKKEVVIALIFIPNKTRKAPFSKQKEKRNGFHSLFCVRRVHKKKRDISIYLQKTGRGEKGQDK